MSTTATNSRNVLALNCGSSSLKFGLYAVASGETKLLCEGEAEEVGDPGSKFWFKCGGENGSKQEEAVGATDHAHALELVLKALDSAGMVKPDAVGHRIVHGGPTLREHQMVRPETLGQLRDAIPFAPLHLPPALAVLHAVERMTPQLPQAVCFDTTFHRTMPDVSRRFALSREATNLGVERFGFHGLSLESILAQMTDVPEKLVIAHLGNGCSITAVRHGQSIDTTMGLTPTGGVMMGTRSGDLDPGVLTYLMRNGFNDREKLAALVDHQSGLLGVSETNNDVRELLEVRGADARADLALRMFCYQVRKAIAAMAAALGGLHTLVFAGGIGENNKELREEICSGLSFLPTFETRVIRSQEDLQIAKITAALLAGQV